MILDTSAVVAVVFEEPGYQELVDALDREPAAGIGAPTLVETAIVLSARLRQDARGLVARMLQEMSIHTLGFTEAHYSAAADAWIRFGKGRHPAALNLGDCMSYAAARVAGRPLLCVGNDFLQTDLEVVTIGA